jgi:hypothetical protein
MKFRHALPGRLLAILLCCLLIAPVTVFAGGHGEDEQVAQVISTEGKSGVSLFLIDLYNDHRMLYALLVTAVMAVLGMVVATGTEIVLRTVGLKTGR